jgi:hypothetical protein
MKHAVTRSAATGAVDAHKQSGFPDWSEESKAAYTQALEDRHRGSYQQAVNALEQIIEVDCSSSCIGDVLVD